MKIHLVDGTYELFRGFYGPPPKKAPDGREVGATIGLLQSLIALLSDPDIENRKHAYKSYIARIIQRKFGSNINVPHFLKSHRSGNKTQTNKH